MDTKTRRHGSPTFSTRTMITLAAVVAMGLVGCETGADEPEPVDEPVEDVEMEMRVPAAEGEQFTATLSPVNEDLLESSPSATVDLAIQGDSLVITVAAGGLPPEMMHLQHFHGFEDGSPARCPGPDADANGDGVIDVTETEAMAGITMVPFHGDPASLEIASESYPEADERGGYTYRQTVSLESLRSAFQEQFGGELALENRVVFIHGVPEDTELPGTAESVMGVPAHVTLPIACGELERGTEGGDVRR